jgi:hypothetical protein
MGILSPGNRAEEDRGEKGLIDKDKLTAQWQRVEKDVGLGSYSKGLRPSISPKLS